jgi:hypothetical protein
LVVSGLLSPQIAERAERTMWALCGLDPKAPPESWLQWGPPAPEVAAAEKVSWHPRNDVSSYMKHEEDRGNLQTNGLQNADLMACATPRYLGAMAQLLGVPPDEMHPPQAVHTQNLLPRPGAERGEVRPHVDALLVAPPWPQRNAQHGDSTAALLALLLLVRGLFRAVEEDRRVGTLGTLRTGPARPIWRVMCHGSCV